jgi:prepilin-type N-terminal cleavage/methylation domain-containing protein
MNIKKGFTLIEMLITVTIVAVLVIIFLPNSIGMYRDSQVKKIQGNGRSLETTLYDYRMNNASYPFSATAVNTSNMDASTVLAIKTQLTKKGVVDAELAYSDIVAAGGFKLIDEAKISSISKVRTNDLNNYFYIDVIPETANYKNEIDGYVFSFKSQRDSKNGLYSALYRTDLAASLSVAAGLKPCQDGGFVCIFTAADLSNMRNNLNNANVRYRLGSDIDLASFDAGDGKGWMPIGSGGSTLFMGLFDGNGFEISNLTINRPGVSYVGLFKSLTNGATENVTLKDVNVVGGDYTGALSGELNGNQASYIRVTGQVTGNNNVGGIAGYLAGAGSLTRSSSDAAVTGNSSIGGVIGFVNDAGTNLSNVYATGSVTGGSIAGGIIGFGNTGNYTFSNSYATGLVNGTANLGGLIGSGIVTSNVFYDTQTSGRADTRGAPKTTTEMKSQATYTGFDFTNVWSIAAGGYPTLIAPQPFPTFSPPPETPSVAKTTCTAGGYTCIMTAADLNNMRNILNNNTVKYRLGADIDLAGFDAAGDGLGWMPIGTSPATFNGRFDGNGFKILNLKINRPTLDNTGLFGYTTNAYIENVKLLSVNVKGKDNTGAIVGNLYYSQMATSYVTGDVSGANNVGGLAGYMYTGVGCTLLKSGSWATVGGFNSVGGVVGAVNGAGTQLVDVFSQGNVYGGTTTGGIVGYGDSNFTFSNAYATGRVTGTGAYIGGTIGSNRTSPNIYYDSTTSNRSDVKGTPKTTAEMKTQSTFAGFDFTTVWTLDAGGYPMLRALQ